MYKPMSPVPGVGHEIGAVIRQMVPPWLTPVFIAITRFGNPAFFLAVFALDYWFGDHRRGAHALSLAIAGIGLVTGLKMFFDAPRPPAAVTVVPISGYSFPSGHATGATIGYGILAYDLEIGAWRARYAVAIGLILLVALSRVVLGVHFVKDVVVGMVLGTAFLIVAVWLTEHDPRPGFVLAVALGAVAFIISGGNQDGAVVFGGAVGAALIWSYLDAVPRVDSTVQMLVLLGVVGPTLTGLAYVGSEINIPVLAAFALNAVVFAGILVAPNVVTRFEAETRTEAIS